MTRFENAPFKFFTFSLIILLLTSVACGVNGLSDQAGSENPVLPPPVEAGATPAVAPSTEQVQAAPATENEPTESTAGDTVETDGTTPGEPGAIDLGPYISDLLVNYDVTCCNGKTIDEIWLLFDAAQVQLKGEGGYPHPVSDIFTIGGSCLNIPAEYRCFSIGTEAEIPNDFTLDISEGEIEISQSDGRVITGPFFLEVSKSDLIEKEVFLASMEATSTEASSEPPDLASAVDLAPYVADLKIDLESWDDIGYESYIGLTLDGTKIQGVNQAPENDLTSREVNKFTVIEPADIQVAVVETKIFEAGNELTLDIWFEKDISDPAVVYIAAGEFEATLPDGQTTNGPFVVQVANIPADPQVVAITDPAALTSTAEAAGDSAATAGDTLSVEPAPGSPLNVETYLTSALPKALEITVAVDQITKILRSPQADRLAWVAAMEPHADAAQAGYETLAGLNPPPEFQQVHATLLEGANACANGTGQIVAGIKGPDQAALDASGPLMTTCKEKVIQAVQLIQQALTGQAAPTGNAESNATSAAGDLPLYPVLKTGKWGFINKTGVVVIEPQFDGVHRFSFPTFAEGLEPVSFNHKWGYIDPAGQFVIEPQFDSAERFSEGLARVGVGQTFGYIDQAGQIVIEPQYNGGGLFTNGATWVKIGEKPTYIDTTGQPITTMQFDEAYAFTQDGLAEVRIGSQWGFIDTSGRLAIEPQFQHAYAFSEGLAPVQLGNKWGYIDLTGQLVFEPQFDSFRPFNEGMAAVKFGDKWGYINRAGEIIIEPQFDVASSFSEGLAGVQIKDQGIDGYIDPTGQLVFQLEYDFPVDSDRATILGDFSDGLAMIKVSGRFGYVDRTGNFVWKPNG